MARIIGIQSALDLDGEAIITVRTNDGDDEIAYVKHKHFVEIARAFGFELVTTLQPVHQGSESI